MYTNLVFDARVLALGVLADQNGVDILVRGLETLDGSTGPYIGEEVERPTESQVQRNVTLANYTHKNVKKREVSQSGRALTWRREGTWA